MIHNPSYCPKKLEPCPMINDFEGTDEEIYAFQFAINQQEYINARTFCEQIGILSSYLRNNSINVSLARIGEIFGVSRSTIFDQLKNYMRGDAKNGRPSLLTNDELYQMITFIQGCHINEAYPIYPSFLDIQDYIYQQFRKDIKYDTLYHIITCQLKDLFTTRNAQPMEQLRMEVPTELIEQNINQLRQEIEGVPLEFIMNLDEMGQQDFADAETKTVIVPHGYEDSFAPYPIERKGDRSTVLVCINDLGIVGRPLFAVKRTYGDLEIYKKLPLNSLEVVHTKKGYINTRSFELFIRNIFIPSLLELRNKYNYQGPAILIMDNYEPHSLALQNIHLENYNVIVHYLPPHASDQLQPLDTVIFGLMKRLMNNYRNNPQVSNLTNQIWKIHNSLYRVCIPSNCKSAFKSIGIDSEIISENGARKETATFKIEDCAKIRCYYINHIIELIQNNRELTPNQIEILSLYQQKQEENAEVRKRFRLNNYS